MCPHGQEHTTTNKVYPFQRADDRWNGCRRPEEFLRKG
jgi:hypothetical protein